MITKYNHSGELEWARSLGGGTDDDLDSLLKTSDGGVLVAWSKGFITKIDGNGNIAVAF